MTILKTNNWTLKIQIEGINAKEIILNVGDNPIIVKIVEFYLKI